MTANDIAQAVEVMREAQRLLIHYAPEDYGKALDCSSRISSATVPLLIALKDIEVKVEP